MINAGLIIEGGGMRGIYSAGVLDLLLDENILFADIYGVSAGACHACSYMSNQRGRAMHAVVDYVGNWRYASFHNLVTTGNFFGDQLAYNEIPNALLPFDYDTFSTSESKLHAVVTNCRTGQAEYRQVRDLHKDMDIIKASSSLPMLSEMVKLDGGLYLDGGISDSIPLARSMRQGNSKNLVILTQHDGYQKQRNKMMPFINISYLSYPRLVESAKNRHLRYNQALELVASQQEKGTAFVIRPKEPVLIGRLEKDAAKLEALYRQGYDDAKENCAAIKSFFEER